MPCSAPEPDAKPMTMADMHPASQLQQTKELLLRNSRWAGARQAGACNGLSKPAERSC